MEFQSVLRGRRAVRDFKPDALPQQVVRRLAEAAVQAPSSMNDQPWLFSVVTDQSLLGRMSDDAKTHLLKCLNVIPRAEHFRPAFSDPAFHIFHHAPVLVVISAASSNPWATEDCTLAAGNMMLAAHDMGLGTCWVGFAQAWLNAPEGRALLGIPLSHHVVAPVVIGYPKSPPPPVLRRAPDIVWIQDQAKTELRAGNG
jgi:nitroreductase